MWEVDYKESWARKHWCFWTVVLEKTLESPLDCKEIQPVHPKGDQSWVFIGWTDCDAETLILWPPDGKIWLIWKDPDAGKDWGQKEKTASEDEVAGWHHWCYEHLLFSLSVVSNSLQLCGLQRTRLPCPSPSPRACSNSCPLSQWCHPTISSSIVPFSSCLQPFSASGSFLMSWLFSSGGHSIGASASVLLMNIQDWLPLGRTVWSPCSQRTLKSFLQHYSSKPSILRRSAFFKIQLTYPYMATGKTIALTRQTFVSKVTSLLFNMLSRLVIAFRPRSKYL